MRRLRCEFCGQKSRVQNGIKDVFALYKRNLCWKFQKWTEFYYIDLLSQQRYHWNLAINDNAENSRWYLVFISVLQDALITIHFAFVIHVSYNHKSLSTLDLSCSHLLLPFNERVMTYEGARKLFKLFAGRLNSMKLAAMKDLSSSYSSILFTITHTAYCLYAYLE